jgi:DNA polymerase-3 subunit delta'
MSWNNIIGQLRIKNILKETIYNKRLPNAFLFYGNEGVGKDAIAIQVAKILNCSEINLSNNIDKNDIDSCNKCDNCIKFNKLLHVNFKMVFALPRGKNEKDHDDSPLTRLTSAEIEEIKNELNHKSQNHYHKINITGAREIRIISIRELKKLSTLSMTEGYYKVFLISNADELNDEAANSLLKILEEPPSKTLFILTTCRKESILPTILSRCQDLYFDNLSPEEIRNGLIQYFNFDEQQAELHSQLAGGSFSQALKLTDKEFIMMREDVVNFLRLILSNKFAEIYTKVDSLLSENNKADIQIFLSMILIWIRDLFLIKEGLHNKILNLDQSDALKSFNDKLPQADLYSSVNSIEEAINLINRNVNLQLIFYTLIIDLRKFILKKQIKH